VYRDKTLLLTGSTGFLGKVVAAQLLHRHPDIRKLYLVVRGRNVEEARKRFEQEINQSPVFKPVHDAHPGLVEAKVEILPGDVTYPHFGLDEPTRERLRGELDLILNSAGLTDFSPSLERAIGINTLGSLNVLRFAQSCKFAAMAHVSTCYVTGRRDGVIKEDAQTIGFYPKKSDLHIDFDPHRELEDCKTLIAQIHQQADDQERKALFWRQAREHLRYLGRDPNDPQALAQRIQEERSNWVKNTLRDEGTRRADHWGWTNTYTYSKSLGEQLLTAHKGDLPLAIVRPAIIESSESFPCVGWNQGINTCAPLTYLLWKGARFVPTQPTLKIDIVPVDHVSNALLMVGGALLQRSHEPIYHVGSSDRNPVTVTRLAELTALWMRTYYQRNTSGPKWRNTMMGFLQSVAVTDEQYRRYSAPQIHRLAQSLDDAIGSLGKTGVAGVDHTLRGVREIARDVAKSTKLIDTLFKIFYPFICEHLFVFKTDALKRLQARLPDEEQAFGFNIEKLDWRHYWIHVQLPGLHKNVYPDIDRKFASSRKEIYTAHDLQEVFEAATRNHKGRVAFQQMTRDGVRRLTYEQVQQRAGWVAHHLRDQGMQDEDRVLIVSENRPEWGISYFGVLQARGVAVPVDAELSLPEILNLARSAGAFALLLSNKTQARLERAGLHEALKELGTTRALSLEPLPDRDMARDEGSLPSVMVEPPPAQVESLALVLAEGEPRAWRSDHAASLIFTSGTTGNPKGVMLAHRNFTALLSSMNQVFSVSERDTFLSVLPLHHTFEFSCGFLMPMSRGATITYLDELSSDSLNRAFQETQVTAMIGVPALWQLLHRRILSNVSSRGPVAKTAFDALLAFNGWLRDRFGLNWGHALFGPVHRGFGGRIRYLISGGASLPTHIMETFHGLGFELLEGYGLTEAAPVLTCARPGKPVRVGTVGTPLPGVEVAIHNPDPTGVGEVKARGGNVMLGYYNNPDATSAVLDAEGWLYTGDLGRFDSRGHLIISGRQKEMILSANGENVYPDELEEVFSKHPLIEELSIVGLPDADSTERVACMVRPKEEAGKDREAVIAEIRKHLDLKNLRLPLAQRIKVLRFTDEPLPRTATRKVKRKEVQKLLLDMEAQRDRGLAQVAEDWGDLTWLRELLGRQLERDPLTIASHMSLTDDLGMESLAFTELSKAIEERTGRAYKIDELAQQPNLAGVMALLRGRPLLQAGQPKLQRAASVGEDSKDEARGASVVGFSHLPASMRPQKATTPGKPTGSKDEGGDDDLHELPTPMRQGLKRALGQAQHWVYRDLFHVKVQGKAHIPYRDNALVIANHCSHLDMGLVKHALRGWAPNLSTLAASDYFFDTKAKRTYFGQLTNLIPAGRSGSFDATMERASQVLAQGNPLLLFPEGTRSVTGELADFRSGMGYLVLHNKVGVLPVYLHGTHRALPKGSVFPKRRKLEVRVGELIPYEYFAEKTQGMPPKEAYREVARLAREAIQALKTRRRFLAPPEEQAKHHSSADLLEELFASLPPRLLTEQVQATLHYYFSLGDDEGAKWSMRVTPDGATYQRGKSAQVDCVVKTNPDMFRKMVTQSYVPSMDEFMSGQIKTSSAELLLTFQQVFGL
jgi:long-chain acyl-CoA synthetase